MNFPLPVSEHRPAPEGTPNDRRRLLPAFGDAIDFGPGNDQRRSEPEDLLRGRHLALLIAADLRGSTAAAQPVAADSGR